jgi:hypothetical protein
MTDRKVDCEPAAAGRTYGIGDRCYWSDSGGAEEKGW